MDDKMDDKMADKMAGIGGAATPSPISALVLGHVAVKEELRDLDESPIMQQQQHTLEMQQQQQLVLLGANSLHVVPRRRPYVRSANRSQAETCVCEVCQGELSRFEALLQHKLLHFNSSHVCYVCDSYFVSVENLLLHMTGVHREIMGSYPKGDAFVCPVCVQRFSSSKSLLAHQSLHSPSNKQEDFSCTICSVDLHTCRGLLAHLGSSRHKEMKIKIQSIFICIDCRSVFANRDSYAFHMMMRAQNEVCDSSHNTNNDKNSTSNCHNRIPERKAVSSSSSSLTPADERSIHDIKPSPPQSVFPSQNFLATTSEGLQRSPYNPIIKSSDSSTDPSHQRQQQQDHLQQQMRQQKRSPINSDQHTPFSEASKLSNYQDGSYNLSIQQQFQQRQLFLDELMGWNALVSARGLGALAGRGGIMSHPQLLAAISETNNNLSSIVASTQAKKRLDPFVTPTRFDVKSDGRNVLESSKHNMSLHQKQILSHQQNLINLWMQRFDCDLNNVNGTNATKSHDHLRARQSDTVTQMDHKTSSLKDDANDDDDNDNGDDDDDDDDEANADQNINIITRNNNNETDGNVFSCDDDDDIDHDDDDDDDDEDVDDDDYKPDSIATNESLKRLNKAPIKTSENKSSQANIGKSKFLKTYKNIPNKKQKKQEEEEKEEERDSKQSDGLKTARKRKLSNNSLKEIKEKSRNKGIKRLKGKMSSLEPPPTLSSSSSSSSCKTKDARFKAINQKCLKQLRRSYSLPTLHVSFSLNPTTRPRSSLEGFEGLKRVSDPFNHTQNQTRHKMWLGFGSREILSIKGGIENNEIFANKSLNTAFNNQIISSNKSDNFLGQCKLGSDTGYSCQQQSRKYLFKGRHLNDKDGSFVQSRSNDDEYLERQSSFSRLTQASFLISPNSPPTQDHHPLNLSLPCPSSRRKINESEETKNFLTFPLPTVSRISLNTTSAEELSKHYEMANKQPNQDSAANIDSNIINIAPLCHNNINNNNYNNNNNNNNNNNKNNNNNNNNNNSYNIKKNSINNNNDDVGNHDDADDILKFVKSNRSKLSMCRHCGLIFTDKLVFYLHMGLHNLHNPWQCNLCGRSCNNLQEFSTHVIHY